jgi:hypothetical protein
VIAPHPTARSMITADARERGWTVEYDHLAATAYVRGEATLTVLWTTGDDVFAATLAGGGDAVPERLGVVPVGDPAATEAVLLGWLHGAGYLHPEVRDISAPPGAVAELELALRDATRRRR